MKERNMLSLILTFNISLIFLQIVHANSVKFEKDPIAVDVLCNSADIDLGTARSVTLCAGHCGIVPACKSFFYVKDNKQCKGVSTVLGSTAGCNTMSSSMYFKSTDLTTTTSTTTTTTTTATTTTTTTTTTAPATSYGTACTTNTECTLTFTYCLQDTCQCIAGYSYNQTTVSCDTDCFVYGNTYIYYPGMALDVSHIAQHSGVSLADCQTHCSNSPQCRGFNFCLTCGNICRLKEETPLTEPTNYYTMSAADYYFRNCA